MSSGNSHSGSKGHDYTVTRGKRQGDSFSAQSRNSFGSEKSTANRYPREESEEGRLQSLDVKLLARETTIAKESLRESQMKVSLMMQENSHLAYQNDVLEQQMSKLERRCKEAVEKFSLEQMKANEMSSLNRAISEESDKLKTFMKQLEAVIDKLTDEVERARSESMRSKESSLRLTKEIVSSREEASKLRSELAILTEDNHALNQQTNDTIPALQENFEMLKRTHDSLKQELETSQRNIISTSEKLAAIISFIDEEGSSTDNLPSLLTVVRKKLHGLITDDRISFNREDIRSFIKQGLQEIKAFHTSSLSEQLQRLQEEKQQNSELLPRYRESLEKLKDNSARMREQMKDLQNEKRTADEKTIKALRETQRLVIALDVSKRKITELTDALKLKDRQVDELSEAVHSQEKLIERLHREINSGRGGVDEEAAVKKRMLHQQYTRQSDQTVNKSKLQPRGSYQQTNALLHDASNDTSEGEEEQDIPNHNNRNAPPKKKSFPQALSGSSVVAEEIYELDEEINFIKNSLAQELQKNNK